MVLMKGGNAENESEIEIMASRSIRLILVMAAYYYTSRLGVTNTDIKLLNNTPKYFYKNDRTL